MIGEVVKVIIDRPMGSSHPAYRDMIYPINYGYVEGIFAFDKEEQDAYILGVHEPIKEFAGVVIASDASPSQPAICRAFPSWAARTARTIVRDEPIRTMVFARPSGTSSWFEPRAKKAGYFQR